MAGRRSAEGAAGLDLIERRVGSGKRLGAGRSLRLCVWGAARGVEGDDGGTPLRPGLFDEFRQFGQAPRGTHDVHQRGTAAEAVAVLLGRAAEETDDEVRLAPLAGLEGADVREDAVLGVGADRARDEQQDAGLSRVVHNGGARSA